MSRSWYKSFLFFFFFFLTPTTYATTIAYCGEGRVGGERTTYNDLFEKFPPEMGIFFRQGFHDESKYLKG